MPRSRRYHRFIADVVSHTPLIQLLVLLVVLWLVFSAGIYLSERGAPGTSIDTYDKALYWSVAAFSTAGIADTPVAGLTRLIGGIWIILGSALFFGALVATITAYFMRPLQRPARQIIDTIEYNFERLDDLTVDELDLLKKTADTLIEHMERIKAYQQHKAAGDG